MVTGRPLQPQRFQKESWMTPFRGRRCGVRIDIDEPILLECESKALCGAVMLNYCDRGLYFESDIAPREGTIISVCTEHSLNSGKPGSGCCAVVRWSRKLEGSSDDYTHGIGAEFCNGQFPWSCDGGT